MTIIRKNIEVGQGTDGNGNNTPGPTKNTDFPSPVK